MDFGGVAKGTALTIIVKVANNRMEFETQVIELLDNRIIVEPVMNNGKMLDFTNPQLSLSVQYFNSEAGKIMGWNEIEIKAGLIRQKDRCHIIRVYGGAFEINRRTNYRLYLGYDCMLYYGRNLSNMVEGIIRDVSNTGLAVILNSKQDFDIGSRFSTAFKDEEYGAKFLLESVVVRIREFDGKYEFGCEIKNPPLMLPKFIAHKQLVNRKRELGML